MVSSADMSEPHSTTGPVSPASVNNNLSLEARLAAFGALALPVAFVPYMFLRRNIYSLRRKVDLTHSAVNTLQKDLKASLLAPRVKQKQLQYLQTNIDKFRQDIDALAGDHKRWDNQKTVNDEMIKSCLNDLCSSQTHIR